jgi:phosphohistidine phosphatase
VKTLLVLRHAKSSWADSSIDDHERPLNARGRRDAPRVGELLRDRQLVPDVWITSDAERAQATAEAAARAAAYPGELTIEPALYLASPADIYRVLRDVAGRKQTVMIVGHNPGVSDLVAQLTGEREELPTAALAQIALPIDDWSEMSASTRGTLVFLWRPKD